MFLFSGCIASGPRSSFVPNDDVIKIAECKGAHCLLDANDYFIGVGYGSLGSTVDIYSALDYSYIESFSSYQSYEKVSEKYFLFSGGYAKSYFNWKIENSEATLGFPSGDSISFNVTRDYDKIGAADTIDENTVVFTLEKDGIKDLFLYDKKNEKLLKIHSYEHTHVGMAGALISGLLGGNTLNVITWDSLVYNEHNKKIYWGLSLVGLKGGAVKDRFNDLFIFDKNGNLLGHKKNEDLKNFVSYGGIQQAGKNLLVVTPNTSTLINSETGEAIDDTNNKYIVTGNSNSVFYSNEKEVFVSN